LKAVWQLMSITQDIYTVNKGDNQVMSFEYDHSEKITIIISQGIYIEGKLDDPK
jgi:hypothetical protein